MTVNHQMITLARDAAGLTQSALATLVGVSQASVSKFESGVEEPSQSVLEEMAQSCDVPVEFFFQPEPVLGEGVVDFYHKKRLTLPAKPLKRANAVANTIRLQAARALTGLELSAVAPFPSFPEDEHPGPEHVAQLVRATWRIPAGPLPSLVGLIEAAAVPVVTSSLGHSKLFAISMPGTDGRPVIVLNGDLSASDQRFALAHELGHLVMHTDGMSMDMESAADRFAAALLLPADDIRPHLRSVHFRDLGGLKMVWRVSLATLIRRAHELGTISDAQYRMYNIQLNQLPGGRKHEPGEFAPEEPGFMRYVLRHYRDDLGYTSAQLAKMLVMNEDCLAERYFGQNRGRRLRTVTPAGPGSHVLRIP